MGVVLVGMAYRTVVRVPWGQVMSLSPRGLMGEG